MHMEFRDVVRVQEKRVTGGYRVKYIVVPKRIAEALGLRKGDLLKVYVEERDGRRVLVYERVE